MNSSRATSVTDKARLWFSYLITRRPSTLPTIPPHTNYWLFCCEANSDILVLADADNADPSAAAGGVHKRSSRSRQTSCAEWWQPSEVAKTLNPNPKCGRIALNGESRQDWISCPFLLLPKSSFLRYVASGIFFPNFRRCVIAKRDLAINGDRFLEPD